MAQVSDRLFSAIIAWGDEDATMRRIADHVCLQVPGTAQPALPREQWRRIAAAL